MRRAWGRLSALTLILLIGLTAAGSWVVRDAVRGQEDRLLRERANEVSLVLKEAVDSLSSQLKTVGGVVAATGGSPAAFDRASQALVDSSSGKDTIALLRKTPAGYRAQLVNGSAFHPGQLVTGPIVATLARAGTVGEMVATPVLGTGPNRALGFGLGSPGARDVLYLRVTLGTLGPPKAANTAPFSELHVVLYDAPSPVAAQSLVTTTDDLPLRGHVQVTSVSAGVSVWTLQVSAVHPLVGGTAALAPWITAAVGVVLAMLFALVVEIESRRRRSALALYRNEHQVAEALQRSLLPILPTVDSLQLAARYLPGSAGQQVGGDWYDVFELDDDQIGVAVGDVLGHDIEAAALMSRVQTALRAYAFVGEQPGAVLDRLDRLMASLQTDRLVTVFYGVLGPADESGSRQLLFANAGHPPPLLIESGGEARELDEASSVLLGVESAGQGVRPQHAVELAADSTLLLYTDGLVEVPGESLTDRVESLLLAVASEAPRRSPADLCDWLLDTVLRGQRRDDVAILVTRLVPAAERQPALRRRRLAALRPA